MADNRYCLIHLPYIHSANVEDIHVPSDLLNGGLVMNDGARWMNVRYDTIEEFNLD